MNSSKSASPLSGMDRFKLGLSSCGFLGCAPKAPGTFGTLGGVLLAYAISGTRWFLLWDLIAIVLVYVLGRSLGNWAEKHAGGEDPQFFVLDEVCGYLVTVLWVQGPSLLCLGVAFLVFRFFDIRKPGWVRRAEKLHGGDGIMLDDVVAGFYGLILVMLPARLLISADWNFF